MATKKKSSKKQTKVSTEQRQAKRKKIVSLAEYEAGAKTEPKATKHEEPVTMTAVAEDKKKRTSGLDAAAQILREAGEPLNTAEMVKRMLDRGLWSTSGKTPAATIYSAIIREINVKSAESRFRKTDRGHFELTNFGKEAK